MADVSSSLSLMAETVKVTKDKGNVTIKLSNPVAAKKKVNIVNLKEKNGLRNIQSI